jgi:predicted RNA-binding Zn ribbon-like protein
VFLDSYSAEPGIVVGFGLVNELLVRPALPPGEAAEGLFAFDPESVADRPKVHVEALTALAEDLRHVIAALHGGDTDAAAERLNRLLTSYPAVPHLVRQEDASWTLHHHPLGAGLVQAWTAICAEALARLIGEGHQDRVHLCAASDCGRAFIDTTKNSTRRFCSERCQNRVKAQSLRRRRATAVTSPDRKTKAR